MVVCFSFEWNIIKRKAGKKERERQTGEGGGVRNAFSCVK